MRTGKLVAALAIAGAVGGAAGALLVLGTGSGAAPAPSGGARVALPRSVDPALAKAIEDLRARLDELQGALAASSREAAEVRADLASVRGEAAAAKEKVAALEASGPPGFRPFPPGGLPTPGADPADPGRLAVAMGRDLPEAARKAAELRKKSEEDRWAAARDALGLSVDQEEALRAALQERNQAIRDSMRIETAEVTKAEDGRPASSLTIAVPDPLKMQEARRKYDDRVSAVLTQDQAKRWKEEGYERALGSGSGVGGGPARFPGADGAGR